MHAFLRVRGAPIPLERVQVANLTSLRQPLRVEGYIRGPVPLEAADQRLTFRTGAFVGTHTTSAREVRRTTLLLGAPATAVIRGTLTLPEDWEHTGRPSPGDVGWEGGEIQLTVRAETPRRLGFERRAVSRTLEVPPERYRRYRRFVQDGVNLEAQVVTVRRP